MRWLSTFLEEHQGLLLLFYAAVVFLVVAGLTGDPVRALAAVVSGALTPP